MIKSIKFICSSNYDDFETKVNAAVNVMQEQELEVEIQHSTAVKNGLAEYCAFLTGREAVVVESATEEV